MQYERKYFSKVWEWVTLSLHKAFAFTADVLEARSLRVLIFGSLNRRKCRSEKKEEEKEVGKEKEEGVEEEGRR
jgi:hypothetical protein